MAYHYYYHSDADRNPYQLPYHHQYSYAPPQALAPQSYGYGNDFDRCEVSSCYDYGYSYGYGYGYGCYGYGDRSDGYPIAAYSVAAGCSEPKQVEWGDGSVREVIAVEDEEVGGCGGGYDPVAAYGATLTVSDAICYSRSEESEARVVAVVDPVTAQGPAAGSNGKAAEEFEDGSESDDYGDGSGSDGSLYSDFSEDDDDFSEDDGSSENSFHHDGVVAAAAGNVVMD
uniref:Uncharacterized protein n=1 Tax=Kalanchoe fedtschenkoi TaxID=63787 RepID=A0A7N0RGW8_KALFE